MPDTLSSKWYVLHHNENLRVICSPTFAGSDATTNFVGSMTFYTFDKIFSGSCAAFASLVILVLMFMHATHLSRPNEQIK
jgi:hypothetical protein